MARSMEPLVVIIGGALGSLARFLTARALASHPVFGLPAGTFVVNVLGAFLMGLVAAWAGASQDARPLLRLFLATGVLGGFTTYSAFNQETLRSLQSGAVLVGAGYAALTLVACLCAGLAGDVAGRWLYGRS
jgi:CrcB protein